MEPKDWNITAGTLYMLPPDGDPVPLGDIAEGSLEACTDLNDITPSGVFRIDSSVEFTAVVHINRDALAYCLGITTTVLETCPNRRVVHLAKHARKSRTRKKNTHRAFRILETRSKKE